MLIRSDLELINKLKRYFMSCQVLRLLHIFALLWVPKVGFTEVLDLNRECIVSILNRTVSVQNDNTWFLANVPANMGKIRARATCLDESGAKLGVTDFFSVQANVRKGLPDFRTVENSTDIQKAPVSLSISGVKNYTYTFDEGGVLTLQKATNTVLLDQETKDFQLDLTAEYEGGRFRDMSSLEGVNYSSSNSKVATVNDNGLVNAVSSGTSLIVVRYDGVSSTVLVKVSLSGDSDSDGIPDDYELANGLNPSDPIDAFEDPDGDGLSSFNEFELGTNPIGADTDGDGIWDGEEVSLGEDGFVTNPLSVDTDNDGLSDSLEIQLGSDPSNGNDTNLQEALVDIEVGSPQLILPFNSIDGESSYQLEVSGILIDGSTIDLTARDAGTTYTSSDLSIVSFGPEDGLLYAGQDGLAAVTVTNSGFQRNIDVRTVTFDPVALSYLELSENLLGVSLIDNTVFAISKGRMYIVSITDTNSPTVIASLFLGSNAFQIEVSGSRAFVALEKEIVVIDISSPQFPFIINRVDVSGLNGISISENYLYAATDSGLFYSSLDQDEAIQLLPTPYTDAVNYVSTSTAYAAMLVNDELVIVDIADIANPLELSRTTFSANVIEINGDYIYSAKYTAGYDVVDITDPENPHVIPASGSFYPRDLVKVGDHVFFAEALFVSAVPFLNVSDPSNPVYQGVVDMSSWGDVDCIRVDANDFYSVCVGENRLMLNQHRLLLDQAGVAPLVSITSPTEDVILRNNRPHLFQIAAEDDVKVVQTNFYIEGELVATDVTEPYSFSYTVAEAIQQLTVRAESIDIGGNVGVSEIFTYEVSEKAATDELWQGVVIDNLEEDLTALSVEMQASEFISDFRLTSLGDFISKGADSKLKVGQLVVEGDLIIDGASLEIYSKQAITVAGNLKIINGGQLAVPMASTNSGRPVTLNIEVMGDIFVDAVSSINLNRAGYPTDNISGPNGSYKIRESCHGGNRSSLSSGGCTYGDYQRVRFAGSAGREQGEGGGLVQLRARQLNLEGIIRANGGTASTFNAGAGGGIHIEVENFSGNGLLSAQGGLHTHPNGTTGGGGRISVWVSGLEEDAYNFQGEYKVNGGISGQVAGAGTAYWNIAGEDHLYVSNAGRRSIRSSTPIRSVGRHAIVDAMMTADGDGWILTVEGTPWRATDEQFDWGLQGIEVDVDASDDARGGYLIDSNTQNTLTIKTADDLSHLADGGYELVGVHEFASLTVTEGASVSFGQDRVIVSGEEVDTLGSVIAPNLRGNNHIGTLLLNRVNSYFNLSAFCQSSIKVACATALTLSRVRTSH